MSFAITAVATTAVSTAATIGAAGISMYGQQQQAKSQSAAANANYAIDAQNAAIQREQQRIQGTADLRASEIASQQADLSIIQSHVDMQNARLQDLYQQSQLIFSANAAEQDAIILDAQAQVQRNNATTLFRYGRMIEQQGNERARRLREQGDRTLAATRGALGASGVQISGSPLEVLADTAGILELNAQDAVYEANLAAQEKYQESRNENFESVVTSINAERSRESAENYRQSRQYVRMGTNLSIAGFQLAEQAALLDKQAAGYSGEMAQYAIDSADAGYTVNMNQASLNQFSGQSAARATQLSSWGTLLSGVSSAAGSAGGYFASRSS